jgi:propanol-preferring alcohol dehydrogenase
MLLEQPRPMRELPLVEREFPAPRPAAGEVLVQVSACGVCRTDLQLCEGDLAPRRLPIVPGHQVVGRVVEVGQGVDPARVGERVGIAWIAGTCGECRQCRAARENLCERATFTGWDRDGGYAERVVARADFVHPLPAGFADVDAAPLLCGGAIGYRSLRVCGIQPGGRLGLYGFGASATIAIQVARHRGCEVFVATRSERERERARRLGAAWAGSYDERPPAPLDAAITFAPAGDVVVRALEAVDRGGTVAINAIHLDRVPEFAYEKLWWERALKSVANVARRDVAELLELAARIPIRTEVELFPLAAANDALGRLSEGRISGAAVLGIGVP